MLEEGDISVRGLLTNGQLHLKHRLSPAFLAFEAVVLQGGICFVLLHFAKLNDTYLLPAPALIRFYNIDHGSKSMPLSYIQEHGFLVDKNRLPSVPYLDIIEQKLLGGI